MIYRLLFLTLFIFTCQNIYLSATTDFVKVQQTLEWPITLERPCSERLEAELQDYMEEKRKNNMTSLLKKGAWAGAGAAGFITLGMAGVMAKGMSRAGMYNQGNAQSSWDLLKKGTFWALCGGVSIVFLRSAVEFGSFVISKLFSKNPHLFLPLLPFAKRMEHALQRLRGAMGELPKHQEGTYFFDHYACEMTDAFTLFVRSLERFCAILFYELKSVHGTKDIVVVDCKKHINRMLTFCEQVAQKIESDLNKERWQGFDRSTFDLIEALEVGCFSLMPWIRKVEEDR